MTPLVSLRPDLGSGGLLARTCASAIHGREDSFYQYLGAPAGLLARRQSRGQDPGVIEDQEIPRSQQCRQLREVPIDQRRPDLQQTAAAAFGGRVTRDEPVGQLVVEVGQ